HDGQCGSDQHRPRKRRDRSSQRNQRAVEGAMNSVKPEDSRQPISGDAEGRVVGAAPVGVRDEASAAVAVRDMFGSIAPKYDFLNHALSMNVDRLWWNRTARIFDSVLSPP